MVVQSSLHHVLIFTTKAVWSYMCVAVLGAGRGWEALKSGAPWHGDVDFPWPCVPQDTTHECFPEQSCKDRPDLRRSMGVLWAHAHLWSKLSFCQAPSTERGPLTSQGGLGQVPSYLYIVFFPNHNQSDICWESRQLLSVPFLMLLESNCSVPFT